MLQTIEAVIDENGILRMLESVELPKLRRVIVTILNEEPTKEALDQAAQSQKNLMLEQKHAKGYADHPSSKDDFSEWESEQVWEES